MKLTLEVKRRGRLLIQSSWQISDSANNATANNATANSINSQESLNTLANLIINEYRGVADVEIWLEER